MIGLTIALLYGIIGLVVLIVTILRIRKGIWIDGPDLCVIIALYGLMWPLPVTCWIVTFIILSFRALSEALLKWVNE